MQRGGDALRVTEHLAKSLNQDHAKCTVDRAWCKFLLYYSIQFWYSIFYRAMLYIARYAVTRCLTVRLSVCRTRDGIIVTPASLVLAVPNAMAIRPTATARNLGRRTQET